MRRVLSKPALKGGLLALLAAALFGLSTPLVQRFGTGLGPFTTAALLYAGAAIVAWVLRQPPAKEAQLQRADWPRLLAMAGMGAVVGPVALSWGLQHTSGCTRLQNSSVTSHELACALAIYTSCAASRATEEHSLIYG